jgi:uncharacterized protein (TIGR03435 family)
MFAFAQMFSRTVGSPIVDRTGLTGYYDFPSIPHEEIRDAADSPSALSRVLATYLGLELKPTREPMGVLVVDHVEGPSAN